MMIGVLLICAILFIVWLRVSKKKKYQKKKNGSERISQKYESEEGVFSIKGTKNNFEIQKDNDLVFTVVNGQIISVKDKKDMHVYEVE